MDEDAGVKAPVTRLRRRLSVESDDVKSPSTPSTPTKKRGGRLAAKPQLELIDENATENVPKRSTRKSVSRDLAEPVEEKTVTPSRRSARIRSNTSLVAETTQTYTDSPRAKRAARRISQAGSDTEAPVTPARQTRRTRKDSTSSLDKQAVTNVEKAPVQVEVIVEELDTNVKDTKTIADNKQETTPISKSRNKKQNTETNKPENVSNSGNESHIELDTSTNKESKSVIITPEIETSTLPETLEKTQKTNSETSNKLSISSTNLIENIDLHPKKKNNNLNKTTSSIEEFSPKAKGRRQRTKSWTTIATPSTNENNFCSDNETLKKKKNKSISGSGDGLIVENKNKSLLDEKSSIILDTSNKENRPEDSPTTSDRNEIVKLLERTPTKNVQSMVYFDDSDSNSSNVEKKSTDKIPEGEDQCVPVVKHSLQTSSVTHQLDQHDNTCEPMDIDVTIPENVSITDFNNSKREFTHLTEQTINKSNLSQQEKDHSDMKESTDISVKKSKRKSSVSHSFNESVADNEDLNETSNKSKRKSSISQIIEPTDETDSNKNISSNFDKDISMSSNSDKSFDDKEIKKLNRKSSICEKAENDQANEENLNSSRRKSSNSIQSNEAQNEEENSVKNSKRKSSLSKNPNTTGSDNIERDNSINKSKRESMQESEVYERENANNNNNLTKLQDKSLSDDKGTNNRSVNKSKRESSISKSLNTTRNDNNVSNNSVNKSIRKSSISNMDIQNLEKTSNENKSTLILSEIKDISTNEIVNVSKDVTNESLSKSVNVADANKADKKNVSQDYLTSTPLQQKSFKKLGMQINSSIISPSIEITKRDEKLNMSQNISKKSNNSESSDESEEEEECSASTNNSKILDDEAEEASDDYESGDSRDDDDRQYDEENEIVEKGETLDTEEDLSDDSDYEKDSFVVSSDEDDDELLSGSGDDLSLSDNELKMTAKSKKKYDERKRKEQKKASREMYEARHKLNESEKSSKLNSSKKKLTRQRLDSSLLNSEEENEIDEKPKKNKRLRIDSSHDTNEIKLDVDESIGKKKNKSKRLSESICNDTAVNEKEISLYNQSMTEEKDPLSVDVKSEPITPQKVINISTALITNVEKLEEIQIDENKTMMATNEMSDPLQATIAEYDDSSSSSDNLEIIENYDSVLENLNKSHSKKIKTMDISLNLNKKQKKNNVSLVDNLNLTVIKDAKKSNKKQAKVNLDTNEQEGNKKISTEKDFSDDDSSSDSIDMRLLFPEDSNDSVLNKENYKPEKQDDEPTEEFIPLKRTDAQTNIPGNMENIDAKDESLLNTSQSKKKNKKNKSILETEPKNTDDVKDDSILNVSQSKKKNKKNKSIQDIEPEYNTEPKEESILNESQSKKKNKNNKSIQETDSENNTESKEESILNVSQSKKKNKNNKSIQDGDSENNTESKEESILNASQSKKKNKNKSIQDTDPESNTKSKDESILNVSQSKKKNKKNKSVQDIDSENNTESKDESVLNVSQSKKKNKNKSIQDIEAEDNTEFKDESILNTSQSKNKKKKNKSIQEIDPESIADPEVESMNVSQVKNNNKSNVDPENNTDVKDESILNVSQSKNKKKKNKSIQEIDPENTEEKGLGFYIDTQGENLNMEALNTSKDSAKKKKKNKNNSICSDSQMNIMTASFEIHEKLMKGWLKNTSAIETNEQDENSDEGPEEVAYQSVKNTGDTADDNQGLSNEEESSKKRKRKLSNMPSEEFVVKDNIEETITANTNEAVTKQKNKKRKISHNDETSNNEYADEISDITVKKSKKNKHTKQFEQEGTEDMENDGVEKKIKKRKAREDDENDKKSKIFKENSMDKIHVTRLPDSILNQLDEKPKTEFAMPKTKAISTTSFVVEATKKRRNKPSNYLEESIYLNDSPVEKKQKPALKKPKVLPFIPTASTSDKGYTSNFRVNVISQETQFVAQSSNVSNFKNDYLANKRIKKLGTLERYKKQRNIKLTKF